MLRTLSITFAMSSENSAYARMIAGTITPSTTAYSAIVCPSERFAGERRRSIQPQQAISAKSARCPSGQMPRPGDPAIMRSYAGAAGSRCFGATAGPARVHPGGYSTERDLLLSLVLQRPARRPVRPLDAGRPRAAVRPRLALLPGARPLLQRRSTRAPRPDARDRRRRDRRGRQLVVGQGIA